MSIRILLKNLNGVFVSFSWISKIWFWISNEFFQLFVFSNCAKCYIHEWKENKQSCCEGVSISKLFKKCFSNCFCRKKILKEKKIHQISFLTPNVLFILIERRITEFTSSIPIIRFNPFVLWLLSLFDREKKKWSVFIS